MKKLLLVFLYCLLSSTASDAQIVYTKLSPPRVLDGSKSGNQIDSVKFHLAHPLSTVIGTDSAIHMWHFDAQAPFSKDVGIDCRTANVELMQQSSSRLPSVAACLEYGEDINATAGNWSRPVYARLKLQNAAGNWDNKTDSFLAVRFKRAGKWHYGWIQLSIDATPTKATISSYAYESTPEKGIKAGDTGTTVSIPVKSKNHDINLTVLSNKIILNGISEKFAFNIYDMNGRTIYKGFVDEKNNEIPIHQTVHGMHIVSLSNSGKKIVTRIVL